MQRAQSISSTSSFASFPASVNSSKLSDETVWVPQLPAKLITRRRLSPMQAAALKKAFQAKSHPLKEERIALATEIGMDLKAVTIWFQNKRQITKRNSQSTKENVPPSHEQKPTHPTRSSKSALSLIRTQARAPLRAAISLDRIAERCERSSPSQYTREPSQFLLSPRRPPTFTGSKSELWKRMASSPVVPPSSPIADGTRFGILPSRSRTMRSLEWACARARVKPKRGEDTGVVEVSSLPLPPGASKADLSDETDTDTEEAITPDSSMDDYSSINDLPSCITNNHKVHDDPVLTDSNDTHPSDEVEAAMVLLGFKVLQ